jgi:hypothetical protein
VSDLPKIAILPDWDCYDWRNAKTILEFAHPGEWSDILSVLSSFRMTHSDLKKKGGGKTAVTSRIDKQLYGLNWIEHEFDTAIIVDKARRDSPTHKVDCFKGKVALEVEWNNKDPFYDRDLNNFRLLYDLRIVDVGVVVTRSTELQRWLQARFADFDKSKDTFGPSTTHYDKLKPKVLGGGAGGCPVLVFAMTPALYFDDRSPAP